ncbi:HalOD1 output domain-containing protein [Natrinema salaciae]|uniref:Halobacterial output domain-containing protein n=1 Tax=Natrinema salaciae TaxID=1186196 RepID=A0A1H9PZL7_9EURY|nr:HalOD1 output domain-containing protein [Natrinema salaciae]SER53657.1 hypothetical protein SAMN04489841_4042 [Natrinema salaciae]
MSSLIAQRESVPLCRTQFDMDGPRRPSTAVIDAISTVADRSPLEIEPLYETIELEALDRLFDHAGTAGSGIALEVPIADWVLLVTGDGQVLVFEPDGDEIEIELETIE